MHADRSSVLIVEDDPATRTYLAEALRLGGFDVETVGDGMSALRQIETNRPDAIVLDLDLPLMNGFAVHTALQQSDLTRTIPIIVVTGTGMAGPTPVAARFDKPIAADTLVETLFDAITRTPSADAIRTILWLCPRCAQVTRETSEPGHPLMSEMRLDVALCEHCAATTA